VPYYALPDAFFVLAYRGNHRTPYDNRGQIYSTWDLLRYLIILGQQRMLHELLFQNPRFLCPTLAKAQSKDH